MTSDNEKIIKFEYFKYKIRNYKDRLPKIKLSIMEERDEIGTFAYTDNKEMEEALRNDMPVPFHYHDVLFTYFPQYRKSILWHEFTHISDFLDFRGYNEVSIIMCTYSEFHATQIEFMKLCGIHRVTTKCRKPLDTIIHFQDRKITIKEYIEFLLAEVLEILDTDISMLDTNMQAANAVALIKHLMYFFGAVSFYYDNQKDMIYKYFAVFDKFGDYTKMFIKLYGNVVINQSFKYDLDGYVNHVNEITYKYLGI